MKLGPASDLENLFIDLDPQDPPDRTGQSTSPIHTLPTELLLPIFVLAIDPHEWSLARVRNIARVCKRWNSVIRSHPRLWAVINCAARIREIRVAIRKAQASQLALVCRYAALQGSKWRTLVSVLASMAPELWSVDIEVPIFDLGRDWTTLSRLTSQVTHFRVRAIQALFWHAPPPFLSIPQGRQLRLLDLHNVVLNWDSPRLSGLTVLRLNCFRAPIESSHLTKILQTSPGLEELTLSSIRLQPQSEEDYTGSIVISLPSLKSFTLTSVDSSFNQLLPLLRVPATARIDLDDADIMDLTVGDDPLIFRVIPPVLPSTPCIVVRITREGCSLAVPNVERKWVHHHINGRFGGTSVLASLQVGCCGPFVTRLDVDLRKELDRYPVETLGRLYSLESLKIHGGTWVRDVLDLISRPSAFDGEHEVWPCPKLSELEVGFRSPGNNGWMASRFHPGDGLAVQALVSTRWRGQMVEEGATSVVARLRSFKIWVPEALESEGLDALASLVCTSARILGPNVVRVISAVS